MSYLGVAALNGELDVVGGFTVDFIPAPSTPSSNMIWRPRVAQSAPLAKPRGSVGEAALNGKLHRPAGAGPIE